MNPPAEKTTDLGYERTRLAADRTLMAWIRTSVSMISFGFTIFKFFMYLRESDILVGTAPLAGAAEPRVLGWSGWARSSWAWPLSNISCTSDGWAGR